MISYWRQTLEYLENHGKITCQDIINLTHTNCPHSVIRDLRKNGIPLKEEIKSRNGNSFKVYFLENLKEEKPKRQPTEPETIKQIGFGLEIPPVEESALEIRRKFGF